jgi:hypothetical protein
MSDNSGQRLIQSVRVYWRRSDKLFRCRAPSPARAATSASAQTLMGLDENENYAALVNVIVTYSSAMGEIFEERLWDGENWEFTEHYVPYLRTVDG